MEKIIVLFYLGVVLILFGTFKFVEYDLSYRRVKPKFVSGQQVTLTYDSTIKGYVQKVQFCNKTTCWYTILLKDNLNKIYYESFSDEELKQ